MARYERLNNVTHRELQVATGFGTHFGDNVAMVPVFPGEYARLQLEYPLFFRKELAGAWQTVAVLGFDRHENLYLDRGRWNAAYLPATVARGPFLIGFHEKGGGAASEAVVHVDMAHPRVVAGGGERVFLADGSNSPYLDYIAGVLRGIHDGVEEGNALYAALDGMELIRPLTIDIEFGDSQGVKLDGLQGIDRERLAALGAVQLAHLHRSGWLEAAYMLLASQRNLERLLAEKRRRLQSTP